MALHRSFLKEVNIFYELYADTRFDVSGNSDNEILDSDSDVPTTSSRKQLRPSAIVFTSDSETSTEEEESSEPESSDDKISDVWSKTDNKSSSKPFLGTTGLNIVIDNPESVVGVMSSVTGDDLIQLLTEKSNLYHSQNSQKWKVLPETPKWSSITPEEVRKLLGLIILMEQVRNENLRD